jgi:hypothetical protein
MFSPNANSDEPTGRVRPAQTNGTRGQAAAGSGATASPGTRHSSAQPRQTRTGPPPPGSGARNAGCTASAAPHSAAEHVEATSSGSVIRSVVFFSLMIYCFLCMWFPDFLTFKRSSSVSEFGSFVREMDVEFRAVFLFG